MRRVFFIAGVVIGLMGVGSAVGYLSFENHRLQGREDDVLQTTVLASRATVTALNGHVTKIASGNVDDAQLGDQIDAIETNLSELAPEMASLEKLDGRRAQVWQEIGTAAEKAPTILTQVQNEVDDEGTMGRASRERLKLLSNLSEATVNALAVFPAQSVGGLPSDLEKLWLDTATNAAQAVVESAGSLHAGL